MVGALNNASGYASLVIIQAIRDESARRDALLQIQLKLIQAEIDLTNAKTKKLQSGGGLINIDVSGVYPELDLVMQTIVQRAQVQANALGTAYLLGI